jgi:hypothetical protein
LIVPDLNPNDWTSNGGLLLPRHLDTGGPAGDEDPVREDQAAAEAPTEPAEQPAEPELRMDGYTDDVRRLEARAAEAERVRTLPTDRVLTRQQELTEQRALAALETREHAARLRDRAERERAELVARADSAAARRELEADTNVRALQLGRRRRTRTLILWAVLGAAMAFTCVNVQRFAAGPAPAWSAQWVVAWFVDPVLSALVIALLLTRGDLAGYGRPGGESRWDRRVVPAVEVGALLAALLMNVAPTLEQAAPAWQDVALHIVIPLAAVAAALALPVVQRRYAEAIASLYAAASGRPAGSPAERVQDGLNGAAGGEAPGSASGRPDGPINRDKRPSGPGVEDTLTDADRKVLAAVRQAIDAGHLDPQPSAYSIYRHVMGGRGDKQRARRVLDVLTPRNGHGLPR